MVLMKPVSKQFDNIPTTVFAVFSALANKHGAVNLGQGFPDTDGPEWIREIAAKELISGSNQYPPMFGTPDLRAAVAEANKRFYGLDVDANTEVLVTSGATEALLDCCNALINDGDEVIILEPFYDSYPQQVIAAGGKPVFVRLNAPDFSITEEVLRAAFSDKTKAIMLNSPMNPAGKVFSRDELEIIAKLVLEFDAYAICDEVYEHLLFDGEQHIPLMALDSMRDRCIRIGSAGKTFSLTGWKIGYITAAPNLLKPIAAAHQFTTFTTPPNLQAAIAAALRANDDYFAALVGDMDEGRQYLADGLAKLGFDVLPCKGTYFLTCDFTAIVNIVGFTGSDYEFCEWLTEHAKVTAIPMSAFYSTDNETPPQNLIRFCFAKKHAVLAQALKNLASLG